MDASPPPSLQHRRIEFHLARKPFSSSFSNNLNNFSNFKLETLNPSSSSSSPFNHHPNSQPPHPSSSSSQASKKHDTSEFFDAAFDLDFGFRIPFRRIVSLYLMTFIFFFCQFCLIVGLSHILFL